MIVKESKKAYTSKDRRMGKEKMVNKTFTKVSEKINWMEAEQIFYWCTGQCTLI